MERNAKPFLTQETLKKMIKNCRNLGVSKLELRPDGLSVEFFAKEPKQETIAPVVTNKVDPVTMVSVEEIKKEAQLNDLMFSDPLAYEELIFKEGDNLRAVGDDVDA